MRRTVRLAAAIGLVLFTASTAHAAKGRLNVLTWEGYADPSFVKPFTEKTGCQVKATYVGSGDEFVAKMVGSGNIFDLVSPPNDIARRLVDAGAVEPVDLAKAPTTAKFFPVFQRPAWLEKDGKTWGIPYSFGIVRIVIDADKVKNPPDSVAVLWSDAYKGKVSLWDDMETLYMAARYAGVSNVYAMSDAELATTKQMLLKGKPLVKKYWFSAGELDTLYNSGEVVASNAWETTLVNAWKAGRNLVEIVPTEGRGGWSDSWMVAKGAGKNPCTYQWLEWVSSPEMQALGHAVTGFGYSHPGMIDKLDPTTRGYLKRLQMDDPTVLSKVSWWQPVKRRNVYLETWNQVKAAKKQ